MATLKDGKKSSITLTEPSKEPQDLLQYKKPIKRSLDDLEAVEV
jgi:hypothetical protein